MRRTPHIALCALLLLAWAGLFGFEAAAFIERAKTECLPTHAATIEGDGIALGAASGLPETPSRFEERLRQGASLQKIGPRELSLLLPGLSSPAPCPRARPLGRAPREVNFAPRAEMSFASHPPRAPPSRHSA